MPSLLSIAEIPDILQRGLSIVTGPNGVFGHERTPQSDCSRSFFCYGGGIVRKVHRDMVSIAFDDGYILVVEASEYGELFVDTGDRASRVMLSWWCEDHVPDAWGDWHTADKFVFPSMRYTGRTFHAVVGAAQGDADVVVGDLTKVALMIAKEVSRG